MSTIHSDWIPNFITAQSPMGLRRMMLLNNAKNNTQFKYFDIAQATVSGKVVWVAWYYTDKVNVEEIEGE